MLHRPPYSFLIAIALSTALASACGSRSSVVFDDLLNGTGGASVDPVTTTGQGGAAPPPTVTSTASGPLPGATGNAVSSAASTGTTANTTATSGAGGAPTTTTSGVGGSNSGGINCGTEVCSGGDICCFNDNNQSNNFCAPTGNCSGNQFIEVQCMNPSDCPGSICCGIFDPQGMNQGYQKIYCDPVCDFNQAGDDIGLIMCGDDPSVCPGGPGDCTTSNTLPAGHKYCD